MSQLPTLIADLALILICAGIMTLLFKKLKQPLVLGYVVAGFLASPHMPFTPSVMDSKSGWFRYHSCLYHYLLYDFVGDRSRYEFRMAPNG